MLPLAAGDLLNVWLLGEVRHPIDRAIALLAFALPDKDWNELVALTIAERDMLLLRLRECTIGPRIEGFTNCAECSEKLEFSILTSDLLRDQQEKQFQEDFSHSTDGYDVQWRLPNSADLAAAISSGDATEACTNLVHRCILRVSLGEKEIGIEGLPDRVIEAIVGQIEARAAQYDNQLTLRCPECGHRWLVDFDVTSFFWAEIVAKVRVVLYEVDALARAYSWRERDILAMDSRRRSLYVQMVT